MNQPRLAMVAGFAPYTDPKIAVAVYVENGGWGATYGVPIAFTTCGVMNQPRLAMVADRLAI